MKKIKFLVSIVLACSFVLLEGQYLPAQERVAKELETYGQENGLNFYRQPIPIIRAYRAANTLTDALGFKSVHHALALSSAFWLASKTHSKVGKFLKLALPPTFLFLSDFILSLGEHALNVVFSGLAREQAAAQLEKAKLAFEEAQKSVREMLRYPNY